MFCFSIPACFFVVHAVGILEIQGILMGWQLVSSECRVLLVTLCNQMGENVGYRYKNTLLGSIPNASQQKSKVSAPPLQRN